MKKQSVRITTVLTLTLVFMLLMLGGCGRQKDTTEISEPVSAAESPSQAEPADSSEAGSGKKDGERFEDVIILEGMEETVRYEHVRNDTIGIEMDYDYESFVRKREPAWERFISIWDDPDHPVNYLEVTCSPEDAETVAASVSETLSNDYDIISGSYDLEGAGSCIRIDASNAKGNGGTPDLLQTVYIIPAPDGCRVATAHYSFESAEGFGRRFSYIVNTLTIIGSHPERILSVSGTWQTASMAYEADGTIYPEYYVRFTDSEILYGHMKGSDFAADHSDKITLLERTASGRLKIQAESSGGVRYTYLTGESDPDILEYYETWEEESFPDAYRGGASLSRSI
jgi:hypothetical protein